MTTIEERVQEGSGIPQQGGSDPLAVVIRVAGSE